MTENLDTARCGPRAAADEHQQEEHNPKEDGPGRVVANEEARGGEGRDDTEERLAEGSAETPMVTEQQHQTDTDAQEQDVKQESPELLVFQYGERAPTQGEQ